MNKYVKTFILAFIVCELVELLFNYFLKENLQQIVIGIVTSFLIAVCIFFFFFFINWDKIKEKLKGKFW